MTLCAHDKTWNFHGITEDILYNMHNSKEGNVVMAKLFIGLFAPFEGYFNIYTFTITRVL